MRKKNRTLSFSKRFKTQLTVSFVLINLITVALGLLFVYHSVLEVLKKQAEDNSLKLFEQAEYNINATMKEVDKLSKMILVEQSFQELLDKSYTRDYESTEAVKEILRNFDNVLNTYDMIEGIYVYGDNGIYFGTADESSRFSLNTDIGFYHTKLLADALQGKLKLVWRGGYTMDVFDPMPANEEFNKRIVISAARRLKKLNGKNQLATMVVNINEKKFSSIYKGDISHSRMYIIGDNDYIISHPDQSNIGQKSDFYTKINGDQKMGSMEVMIDGVRNIVFYYKLYHNKWTLINEIPLNVLYSNINHIRKIIIIVLISIVVLGFFISVYWIYRITNPLNELMIQMKRLEKGELGIQLHEFPKNELGMLGNRFNEMSKQMARMVRLIKEAEEEKRQYEVEALQTQINPHFLYNTLNVIKWMAIMMKATHIADSLTTLGKMLRPIFKGESFYWTIQEEINYVKDYLKIINLRYGEKVIAHMAIDESMYDLKIQKFLLQPIIENSIVHGMTHQHNALSLEISMVMNGDDITIQITDDGIGMTLERLAIVQESLIQSNKLQSKDGKVGLYNINKRIQLVFGEKYGIDLSSEADVGTIIIIKVKKVQKT